MALFYRVDCRYKINNESGASNGAWQPLSSVLTNLPITVEYLTSEQQGQQAINKLTRVVPNNLELQVRKVLVSIDPCVVDN